MGAERREFKIGNAKIILEYFGNEDHLDIVEAAIRKCACFIPIDIRELAFSNSGPSGTTHMEVMTIGKYRYGKIYVYPPFFQSSREEQIKTVTHELVHIHNEPILDYIIDIVIPHVKKSNEDLADSFEAQFRERVERFTEDFARFLVNAKFDPEME